MKRGYALFPLLVLLSLPALSATRLDFDRAPREQRHLLLRSEHPLLPAEREALERMGCRIIRAVDARHYIVRALSAVRRQAEGQLFVAGVESIPERWRVHSSALREISRFGPFARLNILFHDDVSFEEARQAIAGAGGWLESPLQIDFQIPRRLEVIVPDSSLNALAQNDSVLQIHGPVGRIKPMNANAAAMSSVTPLHSAPYNLSGAGVIVSVFDLGESGPALADASHQEFEGRVTRHGNLANADHATHVTGTVAAKGIGPPAQPGRAKGMAPGVRVENFPAEGSNFLELKNANFSALSIRADNNSWGLVHGWNGGGNTWEWFGEPSGEEDLAFAAYGFTSSGLDKLVREHQTLIIYSSGNDNTDIGPVAPPFEHTHVEDSLKYCFSQDGSGTDCPPLCPGRQCEIVRHKRDGPWGTVNLAGSGKNTLAVGAVSSTSGLVSFSSTGPARDGRVKPDLVARGFNLTSTLPNNNYGAFSGTSMSAPVVTGITALVIEQWRKTFAGANPTPEALRVLLLHGAEDLTTPLSLAGETRPLVGPDYAYGFGLVNAKNTVDTIIDDGGTGSRIKSGSVTQGVTLEYGLTLSAGSSARLTLGWSDPESLPFPLKALINDLDLKVIAPAGSTILPFVLNPADPGGPATRGVNNRDNVEQLVIENAAGGTYRVQVIGSAIATATPQTFVMASSATLGPLIVPCVDVFEPNDTIDSAFGRLGTGTSITGKTCAASDVDFYRFVVDRSGPVSVTVTATDTPLRVTLLEGGAPVQSADVGAGASRTLQTNAGSGVDQPITPITYSVRIEPAGTIGPNASYTLTVTFRFIPSGRPRGTRR